MKTYTVVLSGQRMHEGRQYNFGDRLRGLSEAEVERLKQQSLVAHVFIEGGEPVLPLDQVLAAKAPDAVELVLNVDETELLQAILEHEKRATVRKSAEERLAELVAPDPGEGDEDEEGEETAD